jgi:VIT1/CCC1 family predicted Fe2+/Mn2+ transporter
MALAALTATVIMTMSAAPERHRGGRIGWLRAAVLGANDGIVSTASLLIGVAAADASRGAVLVAGDVRFAVGPS